MKRNRHDTIIKLLEQYTIETQEELAMRLRDAGFEVTQATVSRDIRELQLSKVPTGEGRLKYVILPKDNINLNDKYIRILKDGIISMEGAHNLLVIKTVSGMAMAVAAALDSMELSQIAGCIAGDDTIMAAVRSNESVEHAIEQLQKILGE